MPTNSLIQGSRRLVSDVHMNDFVVHGTQPTDANLGAFIGALVPSAGARGTVSSLCITPGSLVTESAAEIVTGSATAIYKIRGATTTTNTVSLVTQAFGSGVDMSIIDYETLIAAMIGAIRDLRARVVVLENA